MVDLAVILAAGLGSRLKGHTSNKPKGFLVIDDLPIIERSINILLENGIKKIIIGTGYFSEFYEELIDKYPQILCVKNEDYANTNSFYTLYNLRDYINKDFLLLESDLYYEKRAVKILLESKYNNLIIASGETESGDEVYIEADENPNLVNMSKEKNELLSVYGELVGINRISLDTFLKIIKWIRDNDLLLKKIDYESVLVNIAKISPIRIEKINDLIWAEIDDENHLNRVLNYIHPKIKEKEYVKNN